MQELLSSLLKVKSLSQTQGPACRAGFLLEAPGRMHPGPVQPLVWPVAASVVPLAHGLPHMPVSLCLPLFPFLWTAWPYWLQWEVEWNRNGGWHERTHCCGHVCHSAAPVQAAPSWRDTWITCRADLDTLPFSLCSQLQSLSCHER